MVRLYGVCVRRVQQMQQRTGQDTLTVYTALYHNINTYTYMRVWVGGVNNGALRNTVYTHTQRVYIIIIGPTKRDTQSFEPRSRACVYTYTRFAGNLRRLLRDCVYIRCTYTSCRDRYKTSVVVRFFFYYFPITREKIRLCPLETEAFL